MLAEHEHFGIGGNGPWRRGARQGDLLLSVGNTVSLDRRHRRVGCVLPRLRWRQAGQEEQQKDWSESWLFHEVSRWWRFRIRRTNALEIDMVRRLCMSIHRSADMPQVTVRFAL